MTKKDQVSKLTLLGSNTRYKYKSPSWKILESFPNKHPPGYVVDIEFPEFSSLCPKTGQPDFACIKIVYEPATLCVESKSLKLYFFAYRQYGAFMETTTNKIADDIVKAIHPKELVVFGQFNPRGGVRLHVKVTRKL